MDQNSLIKKLFNPVVLLGLAGVIVLYFMIRVSSLEKKTTLGASNNSKQVKTVRQTGEVQQAKSSFLGDKGETVLADGDQILIDESKVEDGDLHAFNYYDEKSKKDLYFFVVRDSNGNYRVAANACESCFGAKKGFRQIGDMIRCENCQIDYTKDQIALEKGGCNPRPINKNATVNNGKLVINLKDVEAIAELF
jgi:uncharacterized membrane protein